MDRPLDTEQHPLVRKLESAVDLTSVERDALIAVPMTVRDLRANQDIVREGDRPSQCCLVLEGFAFRYKIVSGDRRQILAFHVPGEIPDLMSLYLRTLDHSLASLTPARVGFLQHRVMRELMLRHPRLAGLFWRETLIDASIFREWLTGVGRRRAPARIANFFCEMFVRLDVIGMASDNSVPLPITQEELGDALGLSAVHTNRTLQELRSKNLFSFEGGRLTVLDWEGLKVAGEFDPTYLHLRRDDPDREA
ncbi:Crp/Fnr family transcriptional regulator [Enterovirga sp. CN4-39]|uniref:Crp/Fnr family transcriptional regulator n=1 Tax=Enterovirga sp. CN4-39 TaxID=3400910 RepID=UPI003C10EA09